MKHQRIEEYKRVEKYRVVEHAIVNNRFSRRALIARVLLVGGGIAASHTSVGRALATVGNHTQSAIIGISKLWSISTGNVRAIDFEDGTLTGSGGFDATGAPTQVPSSSRARMLFRGPTPLTGRALTPPTA